MRAPWMTIGLSMACLVGALAARPAEAGCTRSIVNRSNLTALVSRNGGPWVAVPPHRSQTIRLETPGSVDVALVCGSGATGPEGAVYRDSYRYNAIIDRCYYQFGSGFYEDYLGGSFFGTRNTLPLTLNNPRQGDLVVGPTAEASCPVEAGTVLRSRY